MDLRIALAGNPNCGKTTLFNTLTGANQFVGNWPGVTVEKKEGVLRHCDGAVICDLPGIYSLSPYTPEEIVARNYLVGERPDVILNVVDATALERSLYLTTQLIELGIPVVLALNMMDVVRKNGDSIDTAFLSRRLGVAIAEISALTGEGVADAVRCAIDASKKRPAPPRRTFFAPVERAIARIEALLPASVPQKRRRWCAIKVFERDAMVLRELGISPTATARAEAEIAAVERKLDDDAEAIIASGRYGYIEAVTAACCKYRKRFAPTVSDRIDAVVTSRLLGLPVFAAVMFLVYYISMVTVGAAATGWANDGLFGDGFHLFGIGSAAYEASAGDYEAAMNALGAFGAFGTPGKPGESGMQGDGQVGENGDGDTASFIEKLRDITPNSESVLYAVEDKKTLEQRELTVYFSEIPGEADMESTNPMSFADALSYVEANGLVAPRSADYGVWVDGVPVLAGRILESADSPAWLRGLILDGVIAGVGSVLGFLPQMLVLFVLLAFLESCGYMSRIAFVLDRVFRRFGLSGKSFIPILIGTGCGIPGIMASRTIENECDRHITVMTTTFIPCGAKVPLISMIAGAIFGGSAWVATSAYLLGMAAIIVSGIILKKTVFGAGGTAPFVMELPAYRMPTAKSVLRSTWERGRSFIKKAGTVILLSTIVLWFLTYFGWKDGSFGMLSADQLASSVLARLASSVAWIFAPLGWGDWRTAVATLAGLISKENIVGTLGVLYGANGGAWTALASELTKSAGYSFLAFNLLCAPCFGAIGAIRREMNSAKWTAFAIAYQCVFAYAAAFALRWLVAALPAWG